MKTKKTKNRNITHVYNYVCKETESNTEARKRVRAMSYEELIALSKNS